MTREIFDFWQPLRKLGQPCLGRAIGPGQLDEAGCVQEPLLRSIDRLLLALLHDQSESSMKDGPTVAALSAHQRWINTSAMQKAIRRGQADRAVRHAVAGISLDPQHTLRRLAVCALEDVGIGNAPLIAMALAVVGTGRTYSRQSATSWAAYLAERLAMSPKSRLACDLLSLVDYGLNAGRVTAEGASPEQEKPRSNSCSLAEGAQMIAACGLGGCRLTPTGMTPSGGKATRAGLMRALVQAGAPLLLYYVAERAAVRLRDAMFASILPVWQSFHSEPTLRIKPCAIAPCFEIGGFAAEAFDMHTRSGRLALQRLPKECSSVRDLLAGLSERDALTAIGHAVFIAEGGLLDRRVSYPCADEVRLAAQGRELAFAGIVEPERQDELLATIRLNLPTLHELRRQASALN